MVFSLSKLIGHFYSHWKTSLRQICECKNKIIFTAIRFCVDTFVLYFDTSIKHFHKFLLHLYSLWKTSIRHIRCTNIKITKKDYITLLGLYFLCFYLCLILILVSNIFIQFNLKSKIFLKYFNKTRPLELNL